MEVSLAVGHPSGQPHHGHHRDTEEDDDAHVGHTQVGNFLEHRVELYPVFDQGLVRLSAQAVDSAEDIGEVVAHVLRREQAPVGPAVSRADAAGHYHDAMPLAAVGGLDHEILVLFQQLVHIAHLPVDLHHPVQRRDTEPVPLGQLLGE